MVFVKRLARSADTFRAVGYSEKGKFKGAVRLSWASKSGRGDGITCEVVR